MDEQHMRIVEAMVKKYPKTKRVWVADEGFTRLFLFDGGRGLFVGRSTGGNQLYLNPLLGNNAVAKIDSWGMDLEFREYCCE